jgi:hypothetical protein
MAVSVPIGEKPNPTPSNELMNGKGIDLPPPQSTPKMQHQLSIIWSDYQYAEVNAERYSDHCREIAQRNAENAENETGSGGSNTTGANETRENQDENDGTIQAGNYRLKPVYNQDGTKKEGNTDWDSYEYEVIDMNGNNVGRAYVNQSGDHRFDSNCHGEAWLGGKAWLDNHDVKQLITWGLYEGYLEKLDETTDLNYGDIVVYTGNDDLLAPHTTYTDKVHSASVVFQPIPGATLIWEKEGSAAPNGVYDAITSGRLNFSDQSYNAIRAPYYGKPDEYYRFK